MDSKSLVLASYEDYIKLFDALSHPMRLKIIGTLSKERRYVSELAKMLNISRPLLYMHLKKLEAAAIVTSSYEISEGGQSTKYYEAKPFNINLNSELLEKIAEEIPIAE